MLRSPVEDATPIKFYLAPCQRTISASHARMQRQRLILEDIDTYCIDDWQTPDFVERLTRTLRDAVNAERRNGRDMVLAIALHRDESAIGDLVESAVGAVVTPELTRSTPVGRGICVRQLVPPTGRRVIANVGLVVPDGTERRPCGHPSVRRLGGVLCLARRSQPGARPFQFGVLPILPDRPSYLRFVDRYSEREAGNMKRLFYRVPAFTPTSRNINLLDFGVATFLNNEVFSAEAEDAFSYCGEGGLDRVVFRSRQLEDDVVRQQFCPADGTSPLPLPIPEPSPEPSPGTQPGADAGSSPVTSDGGTAPVDNSTAEPGTCDLIQFGFIPIAALPTWHNTFPETLYELGVAWEFSFLIRLEFSSFLAGSVSAFSASVPFGVSRTIL